jgi:hypothetical protein
MILRRDCHLTKKATITTTSSKILLKSSLCEERSWLLHCHSSPLRSSQREDLRRILLLVVVMVAFFVKWQSLLKIIRT